MFENIELRYYTTQKSLDKKVYGCTAEGLRGNIKNYLYAEFCFSFELSANCYTKSCCMMFVITEIY